MIQSSQTAGADRLGGRQLPWSLFGDRKDAAFYALLAVGGAILSHLTEYYPASLPVFLPWEFSWGWFLLAGLVLWWFGRGMARLAPHERPAVWRTILFLAGMALLYTVLQTKFEYLSQRMFFINRVQHIVMHHLGPFLIALAWPAAPLRAGMPPIARRVCDHRLVRGVLDVLQQPILAAVLFVGLIYLWLIPSVHFVAMIDRTVYTLMNWSMVLDGVLFWCLVLDPRPAPPARLGFGWRAGLAFGVMFPQIVVGSMISFADYDLYEYYAWCGRYLQSVDALADQTYGGLIIWIPASMMSIVSLLLVLNFLRLQEERAESARPSG